MAEQDETPDGAMRGRQRDAGDLPVIDRLSDGITLTAPSLIVTIYGDIAVPRGGVLWMGTLIDICADFDISETQVRTAVSRLVSAERLTGVRNGRRSFYQLAEATRIEFESAARLLFEPIPEPAGWLLHRAAATLPDETTRAHHFGYLGSQLYIRPDHAHLSAPGPLTFRAEMRDGIADMAQLAAGLWPLERFAARYRDVIARFAPLAAHLDGGGPLPAATCLRARLLLVHLYRHALLADPLLPPAFLPADWPGPAARHLFARLYAALSPQADRHVAARFEGPDGRLPETTAVTRHRLTGLAAVSAAHGNLSND